jgi:ribosome-interacting GTPase 1
MTDIQRVEWLPKVKRELENAGMRLNKKAPKVHVHKMGKGAIQIIDPFESLDKEMMIEVAEELGYENAVIQLGEKLKTIDEFIDALSKSRTYIPLVEVVTKVDMARKGDLRKIEEGVVRMNADRGIGIDEFKEKVWQGLAMVRVYLKRERSGEADKKEPLIMKKGQTLDAVLKRVSGEMRDDVGRAYIWGKNARFPGQEVSFSYPVFDEMEVWFGR